MQLPLLEPAELDLDRFFATLEDVREKNPHVHGLHPYPAKFVPHIPRALIEAFSTKGGTVLDPMCGSGTSLVEAALAGREAIGVDINPIAVLVSKSKTTALNTDERESASRLLGEVARTRSAIVAGHWSSQAFYENSAPTFRNREKWFATQVIGELSYLRTQILDLPSPAIRQLASCAFSAVLVAVSNQESETRWCAKPKEVVPGMALARYGAKLQDSLDRLTEYEARHPSSVAVNQADARRLPIADSSVDLVVTSPPYANAHDYYLYNKLRLFWLGHEVQPVQQAEIGSRNRHSDMREGIETYADAMAAVLAEVGRVLKPGRPAAIVVADAVIRGQFFHMDQVLDLPARKAGLSLKSKYRFDHRRFNASFQRGFGRASEKQTHVLVWTRSAEFTDSHIGPHPSNQASDAQR